MDGWIKLHRKITEWEWYHDVKVSRVFLHLLLCACFKPCRFAGHTLKAGQYVTSYRRLAVDTGLSVDEVRTVVKKLKLTGEIITKTTNKYTIVTVVNYNDYQELSTGEAQATTEPSPSQDQTKPKPSPNQAQAIAMHNKNDNNNKNVNKEKTERIVYKGQPYIINSSADFKNGKIRQQIIDLAGEMFYSIFVENLNTVGLNRFNIPALMKRENVVEFFVNSRLLVPA